MLRSLAEVLVVLGGVDAVEPGLDREHGQRVAVGDPDDLSRKVGGGLNRNRSPA